MIFMFSLHFSPVVVTLDHPSPTTVHCGCGGNNTGDEGEVGVDRFADLLDFSYGRDGAYFLIRRVFLEAIVSFWDLNLSRYGHGGKTYLGRYFPRARNPPKWVLSTRKNPSPIDGKETFHVDPRIPGDMKEKSSQNSSHACQIVASKGNNN